MPRSIRTQTEAAEPRQQATRSRRRRPGRRRTRAAGPWRRALSVALTLILLSSQTPASARVLGDITSRWRWEVGFWYQTGGLERLRGVLLPGQTRGPRQERQEERDARVERVEIEPGEVTLRVGQRVSFSAVAYDRADVPVGGVEVAWSVDPPTPEAQAALTSYGEFRPEAPGEFRVTAAGAGHSATARVRVLDEGRPARGTPVTKTTVRKVSPRLLRARRAGLGATRKQRAADAPARFVNAGYRAAAPAAAPQGGPCGTTDQYGNWNDCNFPSALDPDNDRGDPPGHPEGNGNFSFSTPVIALHGRGVDVNLNLVYNSRVWNKSDEGMTFDIDRDNPAPGWSLGFGTIVNLVDQGAMLVEPDGTRRFFEGELRVTTVDDGTTVRVTNKTFIGHTTDGSFIKCKVVTDYARGEAWGDVDYPDGTTLDISYYTPNNTLPDQKTYVMTPHYVWDGDGNLVTIIKRTVYSGGQWVQQISRVIDTLNRVIDFRYDANNLLTSVTAAGLRDETTGATTTRELVRLHYRQITLGYNFGSTPVRVRTAQPYVLDAIYYPGSGTGYWFGDSDSYSSYGMLRKVIQQRAMGFAAASPNEQGIVTQGMMTSKRTFDYPLTAGASLTRAPTYTTETETWDGMDTAPVVTTYEVDYNSDPRTTTVTLCDNTKRVQRAYNADAHVGDPLPAFKNNLVYEDSSLDDQGRLIRKSTVEWEEGFWGAARPHRTEDTSYTPDGRSLTLAKEYLYGDYNAVTELKEFDYGGALARRTVTEYLNRDAGDGRYSYLLNLATSVSTYAGDGARFAFSTYAYDEYTETPLVVTTAPHREAYPYATHRGHATTITRYADANAASPSGALVEKRTYDDTGNLVAVTEAGGVKVRLTFNADTGFAYATSLSRGSAEDAAARVTVNSTYDYNTGLQLTATDPNGRTTTAKYDLATWRPTKTVNAAGAYTLYSFDDAGLALSHATYLADGALAAEIVNRFNGRGTVRRSESREAGSVWVVVETTYDKFGRARKQSVPFRSNESAHGTLWTENTYDDRGRVTQSAGPDGSVNQSVFDEAARPAGASSAPGPTTKIIDAWGRERWGRADFEGRLVEVVEPNPDGGGSVAAGGLVTTYAYDAAGNLRQVSQGAQLRTFEYDSLARLTRQKLAEAAATLDAQGNRVGVPAGQWSDVFTYDARSNLSTRTDARGVKTVFSFSDDAGNFDPLNRLLSVSYQTNGAANVLPAPKVTYSYVGVGDVTRLHSVTAEGASVEEFDYDTEGRVKQKKLTVLSRPDYPFVSDYLYDSLSRTTDTFYPAQEGFGAEPRKAVHQDYDAAGRTSGLKVDAADYASQLAYNSAGQVTSVKIGPAGSNQITENNVYDPATGLIAEQKVFRGAEVAANRLLHLSYDYLLPGTTNGRTGQVTKVTNQISAENGRTYSYDALGRLKTVGGGDPAQTPAWTQTYSYDRYGNRKGVAVSGGLARLELFVTPPRAPAEVAYGAAPLLPAPLAGLAPSAREFSDSPAASPLALALGNLFAPAALLDAPTDLVVTSSSAAQVGLSWAAPAGQVSYYQIERGQSLNGPFTVVGTSQTASFNDATVGAGNAYLYRVRAVDASGVRSGPSNAALGAAFTFDDDPIVTQSDHQNGVNTNLPLTNVRVAHINQLRAAVNAVRHLAGMGDYAWTNGSVGFGSPVAADDVRDLRTALAAALNALGISPPAYTDQTIYNGQNGQRTVVKRAHIKELRDAATRGRSAGTGGAGPGVPRDGIETLDYDPATNRIITAGYEYDDAGNQTRLVGAGNVGLRLVYDAAGRLAKVKTDGGTTVETYTYNYSRRRIVLQRGAESSNDRTYYVWGTDEVFAEFTETDAHPAQPVWSKNYIYLSSTLLATQTPAGGTEAVEFHHPDRLGTRVVTNAAAGTWYEQVTLPFGTAMDNVAAGRRFTSYERDFTTGLDYALNRTYDSGQGRFAQPDPLGMQTGTPFDPQSLNLYAYCGNDPVNQTDPSGLWPTFTVSFFPPIPGFGGGVPRTGWFWNGGLTGLFSFGLGILSWLLSHPPVTGLFRPPFVINTPRPAPVPPPPPPPPVTRVAVYGIYSQKYPEGDTQAFMARAKQSAGKNTLSFTSGRQLLENLGALSARVGPIDNLYVYGHAHPPGIIGSNSQQEGLYIEDSGNYWAYKHVYTLQANDGTTYNDNYHYSTYFKDGHPTNPEARTADDFANAILRGDINIATNGEIVFFGCHTHALASHVQWKLRNDRPDIRVTGVFGQVSFANSNFAQAGVNGWETFTGRDNTRTVTRNGRRSYK